MGETERSLNGERVIECTHVEPSVSTPSLVQQDRAHIESFVTNRRMALFRDLNAGLAVPDRSRAFRNNVTKDPIIVGRY